MSAPAQERHETVRRLIQALIAAIKARTFYPSSHPSTARALADLGAALESVLALAPEVVIGVVGRDIVADGQPVTKGAHLIERFRLDLEAHGLEKVAFRGGARPEDLEALVEAFCTPPETLQAEGGMERRLAARGVRSIQVGRVAVDDEAGEAGEGGGWERALGTYRAGIEQVAAITDKFHRGRPVSAGEVREVTSMLVEGLRGQRSPMLAALALRQKSPYTFSHSLNVSILLLAQVEMLDLPTGRIEEITAAGLLHDIGKLDVPDEIVAKPGPLTDEEWRFMRRHPVAGAEALARMRDVSELALVVAFEHHLRYDGTGYPARRAPWPLHRLTHMASIADSYDAMRSHRPYDSGWTCERVYHRMMELSGTAFHPGLLDRFFRIIGRYPPGTVVRLSSGETAKVVRNEAALHDRPVVQVLRDGGGKTPQAPLLIDLAWELEQHGPEAAMVLESVPDLE